MKDCGYDCKQPSKVSRHNDVKDDCTEGMNTCEQKNIKCDRVGGGTDGQERKVQTCTVIEEMEGVEHLVIGSCNNHTMGPDGWK